MAVGGANAEQVPVALPVAQLDVAPFSVKLFSVPVLVLVLASVAVVIAVLSVPTMPWLK